MAIKHDKVKPDAVIESWVMLYTNSLYSWALYMTSSKEWAEDLVQDTFLAAHLQLDKFRNDSNPKTWLLAILNNKISEHYRRQYRNPAQYENSESSSSGNPIFDLLFDENDHWRKKEKPKEWDADEGHLLDNKEFNDILTSCLGKLPEHWRSAVYLKYIEQKKGELICQELGIAATNFWQVLHRAKLQLRKCLELNWFKS